MMCWSGMKGRFPRLALPGAVASAAAVVASALLLGHANGAVTTTAATPQRGVVIVNTNLAYEDNSAAGTGIVLTSSGQVLTNNHVIRGASSVRVTDPSDGRTFSARVLGYSVSKDVALLQLRNPRGLSAAVIGNSSTARLGQHVTAVGNAGGTGSLTTVTGSVTGLTRSISVSDGQGSSSRLLGLIETNAPLEPGDSGGPLLAGGRVIGMNAAASEISGYDSSREGYAIPINRAVSIAHQIESGRKSTTVHIGPTAFLGVALEPPDYPDDSSGAIVGTVLPGSVAERAGIESGDVIIRAAGRVITSSSDLRSVMLQAAPGKPLRLSWTNSFGSTSTATVRPPAGPPQ
jgi:S1-C subfamily serine protease